MCQLHVLTSDAIVSQTSERDREIAKVLANVGHSSAWIDNQAISRGDNNSHWISVLHCEAYENIS